MTDYTTSNAIATINVDKATPTITWADPADIIYGTPLSTLQLDATSLVPGKFTYTPAKGTLLDAGTAQTLSVSFVPDESIDYNDATVTAEINVVKATPSLVVSDPGGTFNGSPFPASVTIAGINNTPSFSLENTTPSLTYYAGPGTSGGSLGSAPPAAPGTYTVVASFSGTPDYAPTQSKPITFTIGWATATLRLTSSGGSAMYGQPVTFVAAVTAPAAPGGAVTFLLDGKIPLATIPIDGPGIATFSTSSLSVSSHTITATYDGDTGVLPGASETAAESVGPAATHLVLTPQPVFKKKKLKSVSLTAEIEAMAPGGGIPTGGMVTFELFKKRRKKISAKTLGAAVVNAGTATLTLKPNQVLRKTITILYGGDTDYTASVVTPPKLTTKALKHLVSALTN